MLEIVKGILRGERRSLAKAISVIDNDEPDSQTIIREIFDKTGNARTVGFTGSGGAGKSSLIGKLVPRFHDKGYKVAILAVDPTSPVTGGAILGDRVRMQDSIDDERVFMRSIASRGAVGGISKSLRNIIRILDAAGYNLILVESVGAGQLEVEISKIVNLTVVVFMPNTGDNLQAIKAGLTEIGDIYIVNKGDLEGSNTLFNSILDLIGNCDKKTPVLKVSAKTGKGTKELALTIDGILKTERSGYKEKQRKMLESELKSMTLDILEQRALRRLNSDEKYYFFVTELLKKRIDPYQAAEALALSILDGSEGKS
jgi:LAO/AO transport system kinase